MKVSRLYSYFQLDYMNKYRFKRYCSVNIPGLFCHRSEIHNENEKTKRFIRIKHHSQVAIDLAESEQNFWSKKRGKNRAKRTTVLLVLTTFGIEDEKKNNHTHTLTWTLFYDNFFKYFNLRRYISFAYCSRHKIYTNYPSELISTIITDNYFVNEMYSGKIELFNLNLFNTKKKKK